MTLGRFRWLRSQATYSHLFFAKKCYLYRSVLPKTCLAERDSSTAGPPKTIGMRGVLCNVSCSLVSHGVAHPAKAYKYVSKSAIGRGIELFKWVLSAIQLISTRTVACPPPRPHPQRTPHQRCLTSIRFAYCKQSLLHDGHRLVSRKPCLF